MAVCLRSKGVGHLPQKTQLRCSSHNILLRRSLTAQAKLLSSDRRRTNCIAAVVCSCYQGSDFWLYCCVCSNSSEEIHHGHLNASLLLSSIIRPKLALAARKLRNSTQPSCIK